MDRAPKSASAALAHLSMRAIHLRLVGRGRDQKSIFSGTLPTLVLRSDCLVQSPSRAKAGEVLEGAPASWQKRGCWQSSCSSSTPASTPFLRQHCDPELLWIVWPIWILSTRDQAVRIVTLVGTCRRGGEIRRRHPSHDAIFHQLNNNLKKKKKKNRKCRKS